MVDREGGVDLDAIADATQAVSPMLDSAPLDAAITGPYALEVSSPGLERPLRTPAHFARAVGETVSVKSRAGDDHGSRRVRGVLTAADATGIELLLDDGATERVEIDAITQARTVFEWGNEATGTKPGTKPRANSGAKSRSRGPKRTKSTREEVVPR